MRRTMARVKSSRVRMVEVPRQWRVRRMRLIQATQAMKMGTKAGDADEVGDLDEGGVAVEGDAEAVPAEAGEDPAAEPLGGDPGGGGEGGAAEGLEGAGCGGGLAEGGDAGTGVAGDEPGPEAEVNGEDAGEA
jgi:hypothetical protein